MWTSESARLKQQHEDKVKAQKKKIADLEAKLLHAKTENKKEETKHRGDYKKADSAYQEMIHAYDNEMNDATREKAKVFSQYEETNRDLGYVQEDYKQRLEERKKREEILEIMKKKNEEQQK